MTVYHEDWSGSTVGQEPTGWTKRWAQTGVTWEVVTRAEALHGRALKVNRSSNVRAVLSHDAASSDAAQADMKMRALVQLANGYNSSGPAATKFALRASGAAGAENGYTIGPAYDTNNNFTNRHAIYSSGSFSVLASGSNVFALGGKYWIELEVTGTSNYVARAYAEADTNFSSPLVTVSNTDTTITSTGWLGIFGFTQINSGSEYWEDIVFATNGDALPPVGGSGSAVKGARVRLYDSAGSPIASETGIQVAWFDQPEPKDFLAPEFVTTTGSTDADGWLEINLNSSTLLEIGSPGFLLAYKLNSVTPNDSPVFAGRIAIEDIQ